MFSSDKNNLHNFKKKNSTEKKVKRHNFRISYMFDRNCLLTISHKTNIYNTCIKFIYPSEKDEDHL